MYAIRSYYDYVLAARLSGMLKSAFPDGPPDVGIDTAEPTGQDEFAGAESVDGSTHLAASAEPANVILIGDVDMLDDRLWVQVQSFFGQQIANAFASNGALIINALENLSGVITSYSIHYTKLYDAVIRYRDFEHGLPLQRQLEQAVRFVDDLLVGVAQCFDLQFGHHLGQLDDRAIDVRYPMSVHKGRCRRQALDETEFESLFDLVEVD